VPIDARHSTGNSWERRFGYSRSVRAGDWILTTGTLALTDAGEPFVPEDGRAQTSRCLAIIERAIAAHGGSRTDIVRTRFYVTDIGRSEEFGQGHRDFFGEHAPCLTMVEVAALIGPGFLVEIEAEAFAPIRDGGG